MTKPMPSDWTFFAESDLELAKKAYESNIHHLACFHAQQSAEKTLKAYLVWKSEEAPKTHKLIDLYYQAKQSLPEISEFESIVVSLDRYYLPTRYPDALPGSLPEGLPTKEDAEQAIADAERIAEFLKPFLIDTIKPG